MNASLPDILQFRVASEGGADKPYKIPCLHRVSHLPYRQCALGYPYEIAKVPLSLRTLPYFWA